MKRKIIFFMILVAVLMISCDKKADVNVKGMVKVDGGMLGNIEIEDFYICDHEVTQVEWKFVMGKNPSYFKGDNLPVEKVSWYDAVKFCNKLSEKSGIEKYYHINGINVKENRNSKGYRLLTADEWEFAARGGNKSNSYNYSGSDNIGEVAWYYLNSREQTHDIKTKKPNELGLYDMSGNVWEWTNTSDGFDGRVICGGSWHDDAFYSEVSFLNSFGPSSTSYSLGFRLARSI